MKKKHNGWRGETAFGRKVRSDPGGAAADLLEALERSRGSLQAAASELGVDRVHLYRLGYVLQDVGALTWNEVDAVRARWSGIARGMNPDLVRASEAIRETLGVRP